MDYDPSMPGLFIHSFDPEPITLSDVPVAQSPPVFDSPGSATDDLF